MQILNIKISTDGWDYCEVLFSVRERGSDAAGERRLHRAEMGSEDSHLLLQELLESIQAEVELEHARQLQLRSPL